MLAYTVYYTKVLIFSEIRENSLMRKRSGLLADVL